MYNICRVLTSHCENHVGAVAYSYAYFGQGYGGIFLDNVACSGTENMLMNCSIHTSSIGAHNCQHNDDAGVRCQGTLDFKRYLLCKIDSFWEVLAEHCCLVALSWCPNLSMAISGAGIVMTDQVTLHCISTREWKCLDRKHCHTARSYMCSSGSADSIAYQSTSTSSLLVCICYDQCYNVHASIQGQLILG